MISRLSFIILFAFLVLFTFRRSIPVSQKSDAVVSAILLWATSISSLSAKSSLSIWRLDNPAYSSSLSAPMERTTNAMAVSVTFAGFLPFFLLWIMSHADRNKKVTAVTGFM